MKTFIDRFKKIIADDGGHGGIIAANKLYECDAMFATHHCDSIDMDEDKIDEYMKQTSMEYKCHMVPKMLMCHLNDMDTDEITSCMRVAGYNSTTFLETMRYERIGHVASKAVERKNCNYGVTV